MCNVCVLLVFVYFRLSNSYGVTINSKKTYMVYIGGNQHQFQCSNLSGGDDVLLRYLHLANGPFKAEMWKSTYLEI